MVHHGTVPCTSCLLHLRSNTCGLHRLGGGVVRGPSGSEEVLRAVADFPFEWLRSHPDMKETLAQHEVLNLLVEARLEFLRAKTITMDADNKTDVLRGAKGQGTERAHAKPSLQALLITWRLGVHSQVTMDSLRRELGSGPPD